MVSSTVQSLVCDWVSYIYFCFYFYCFGRPKRIYLYLKNVLLMFSCRIFMVSCLVFKSLSHFEFMFVCVVRECSNFIDLHAIVQFSQHYLLKRLSFLHCIFLPPLLKLN